jgi:ferritin-like protein
LISKKETEVKDYHEPVEELGPETRHLVRALNSLKEEIEAVDWYNQRMETTTDESLKNILKHNRDEEVEHACMTIEWLRRNMPIWDEQLRTYLFSEGDIVDQEDMAPKTIGDLGIGKIQ